MSYSPSVIANYFLNKASAEDRALTPMQLLKLVYIAHGWHLGYEGRPLLNEEVQAWRYGPVVHSLYKQVKHYGRGAVRELLPTGRFPWSKDTDVDQNTALLLDMVWKGYGHYSGTELSDMTHRQGSPWWTAWVDDDGRSQYFAVIDDDVIKAFYERKIARIRDRTEEAANEAAAN
ncbi:Panacea domain-containing protein [Lysobacter enzymogenes]|uniref:Panacea domain-containing protein n=1 Tax=Lysobacter enzymogenes TaxID=69 RepID=UPI0019D2B442|nr:type II toxin-antitoxin system antitoxin SocA domain-containing protein [Lysobacter enzymogenes]